MEEGTRKTVLGGKDTEYEEKASEEGKGQEKEEGSTEGRRDGRKLLQERRSNMLIVVICFYLLKCKETF